ncbi:MAG TPA: hypothetical protein VLL97_00800 [Acidobacteriota bacterium]|nr:hypothetical protein [Acidobacteriota bacterium]
MLKRKIAFLLAVFIMTLPPAGTTATGQSNQPDEILPANELDEFMARVMKKREMDHEALRYYIFSERETLDIRGPDIAALESFHREYDWFVRGDDIVRSPVRINGVAVSAGEQAAAEKKWLETRKKNREKNLDRETFFGFRFKPGRYLFAGRERFEGHDVVVIEYYPGPDENDEGKTGNRGHLFEKSFLVTMLVIPEEHQIVKLTFDNVGLEFLPGRWLFRIDDIKASLVMHKVNDEVWLPREISVYGSVSTAEMTLSINYLSEFFSYSKSDVRLEYRLERGEDRPGQ